MSWLGPLVLVLVSGCHWMQSMAEFYTAMTDMERLLQTEGQLAQIIDSYIETEEKRLQQVRWLTSQYEQQYKIGIRNSEEYLSNPVNAYLLIKRLTADLQLTFYLTEKWFNKGIQERIMEQNLTLPTDEDLKGAGHALMRLQKTYQLDTGAMAKGKVPGVHKLDEMELTAGDCFEIGRQAYDTNQHQISVTWLQEAANKLREESRPTARLSDVLELLGAAYFGLGNAKRALEITQEIITLDPQNFRAYENLGHMIQHIQNGYDEAMADRLSKEPKTDIDEMLDDYERLCRGEQDNSANSSLRCYYTSKKNPFFLLQPFKVEELYLAPKIVMFHDIISAEEVEALKTISKPKLERATVQDDETGNLETAAYRISKSAWLEDFEDEVILRVNRRLEQVTELSVSSAEHYHVINYGIGGQYEPHYDFAHEDMMPFDEGNRIATIITYLSDVESGGATVFPSINVTVHPVKGSATFWHNLYKSGRPDYLTRHAGCPVLVGSKWIGTKWFHEMGQEFRRKCDKNPEL